jgi:hypothetical protein
MDKKNHLITPLVIAAAVSVVAFASVGVAAITGHLSIKQLSPNPLAGFTGMSKPSAVIAPAAAKVRQKTAARNQADKAKPIDFRPGARVASRNKAKCGDCGVVDSIRAKEIEKGGVIAVGLAPRSGQDAPNASGRSSGLTYAAVNAAASEARIAVNFVVTLRMEDGTVRTIYENQRPPFSIGERVRLVNGSVMPLG